MRYRELGRTGVSLSVLGVGGGRLGLTQAGDDGAAAILDRALELGVNYIDTATSYGRGVSEERIGRALSGRRDRVFLATKLDQREKDAATAELRGSLARLQTEWLDLIQVHAVNDRETLDRILAPGGVVEALEEARRAGGVRFIGITGHREPAVLRAALERYDFDTVRLPCGCMDASDFLDAVMPLARQHRTGLLGMKAFGHGAVSAAGSDALVYALGQPVTAVVVGMNTLEELDQNTALSDSSGPLDPSAQATLMAAAEAARTPALHWWRNEPVPVS
jgi:aryl-alcohol dehydrogenase-like predicted oxidoreductase